MIVRTHRFHGHGSLQSVYRDGRTVRSTQLGLKYHVRQGRSSYRVAVVVSRKVSKSAVVRNRIRRRMYEVVRTHASELKDGYDLIFTIFMDQLGTMEYAQLEELVLSLLGKANILQQTPVLSDDARHDTVKQTGIR